MIFIAIIFLSALMIAGTAGFFSIYGLANIYTAAFWSVIIMGASLEIGKLVAASFLQRYWTTVSAALKYYLITAIIGLMIITSAGIFGYLSNAYQQDSVAFKDVEAKVELLKQEEIELGTREKQIDADIARVGENYVRARIKLINSYKEEKKKISDRRFAIREEMQKLSTQKLEVEAHTGPIIYIARAFGEDVDTAIKWMTLLIIFVFDPLAIALTLAGNHALMQRQRSQLQPPSPQPPQTEIIDFTTPPTNQKGSLVETLPEAPPELMDAFVNDEPSPSVDTEEKLENSISETKPEQTQTPPPASPPVSHKKEPFQAVLQPSTRHRRLFGTPSEFVQKMIKNQYNNER